MGHRTRARSRRGAAALEAGVTLTLFLALMLGMLDLGLGVFRHHVLSHASRQLARAAMVHGALSDRLGPWGPAPLSGNAQPAGGSDPLAMAQEVVAPHLVGVAPQDVTLLVEWPDGGNDPFEDHRVRVTLSTTYQPVMTFLLGGGFQLQAVSLMPISH